MDIRPFDETSDADYAAVLAIRDLARAAPADASPQDAAEWRARDPRYRSGRLLAESGGQIVGYAAYDQNPYVYHPRKFTLEIAVRPEQRRRGIGAALFDRLIESLAPFDPLAIKSQADERDAESRGFLQRRGFVETNRRCRSALDLTAFDPRPYAGLEQKLQAEGIALVSWPELAGDPERASKLYALDRQSNQDTPEPDPVTLPPLEDYLDDLFGDPRVLPEALFVAVHNGRYVGRSSLDGRHSAPGELEVDFTGVDRQYRGRGIALALKLRGIAYALEHGIHTLTTDNDSANAPMLAINDRLGFVRQPATIYLEKQLAED